MTKVLAIIILSLFSLTTYGQTKMRSIDELIDNKDPGWAIVKGWINSAKNKIEILPVDTIKAKDALYKTQVTTHSPMGAIVYMTGGLLVDHGWIRILGSGSSKLSRSLPEWNRGKTFDDYGQPTPYLLIADDAIGGIFILNGGGLGSDLGKVYYLAPDNLEYEPLDLTYSDFLNFCFNNNLDEFYKDYRWKNWKNDVAKLKSDQVFSFFPYLWTEQGKNINKVSKKEVPIEENYRLTFEYRKQLGFDMQK
ncbi:Protein of unknown function DUF2625 [Chryseobacterium oranimense]|uniref:DUF2625 domain-containing protein n=1 Tax=Chryseobacterium oranimense TaxID=421058 RepID=A0A1M5R6F3_9FLAO|nr:DUF2625 domain-containing protein [Chryseobacterium oranimense]SHH21666.1 Protein of unknown function DUF2625 [Chryseobacterium oranimense]